MNFMQFFVWGSWLISLGAYMIVTLGFSGGQVGSVYATMGIGALFMPGLMGIVADRWLNAERVLGLCHLVGAGLLLWASTVKDFETLYMIMLLNAMVYMPTIGLANTVSYKVLEQKGFNIIKTFPPIRVWGTIGFIAAMWMVDLAGWNQDALQLYLSAGAALFLGVYAFTMPPCPPVKSARQAQPGVGARARCLRAVQAPADARVLHLRDAARRGAADHQCLRRRVPRRLQDRVSGHLRRGASEPAAVDLADVRDALHPDDPVLPAALRHQDGDAAQHLRLGVSLRAVRGRRSGPGLWMLVLSMIIYGMAFDFFNISGSLFVDREADAGIRASAQGLFMIMTNGLGAFLGATVSGWVVDYFTVNGVKDWQSIWLTFAGYALRTG